MKAVIFAGGSGTRLSEESNVRPKPMIEIGNKPILWHILKIYSHFGINDFIICCGYKSYAIKEYFSNYFLRNSDVTFDLGENRIDYHHSFAEPWKVTLVDTGEHSMTGGRLKRVQPYIGGETFCLTYGDGLTDANLSDQIDFHHKNKRKATLMAVRPPGKYGTFALGAKELSIRNFEEKATPVDGPWINAGFFVCEPAVIDLITDDTTVWEREPLEALAQSDNLAAYRHLGFWQSMDTLRDKTFLEEIWNTGAAPWKSW